MTYSENSFYSDLKNGAQTQSMFTDDCAIAIWSMAFMSAKVTF